MKTIKKIVSLLIIAALLTGCASTFGVFATAFAADIIETGSCGENVTYTLDSDGVLTVSGSGTTTGTKGPAVESSFQDPGSIRSVVIEEGVKSIGPFTFYNCTALTGVTMPDSLESIGDWAFGCTALDNIRIPDSVTSIGQYAFYRCMGLKRVSIHENLTSIGMCAFAGCADLAEINVADGNPVYHSAGNCVIDTTNKILVIGCKNSVIPDDGSVEAIGNAVDNRSIGECTGNAALPFSMPFCECTGLTSITIPESVKTISEAAFSYCTGLKNVTINGDVSIAWTAFYGCDGITSLNLSEKLTTISKYAFYGCTGLTSVVLPDSVISVGGGAFYNCTGLTSVVLPDSVISIGAAAFGGCTGLETIEVSPDNPKYHSAGNCIIETETNTLILGCKNSVIPDDGSVTSINEKAFYGCKGLTSIVIPNTIKIIGYSAFEACTGLTSIIIRDGVTSIKERAFCGCSGLTSIVLPDSVTEVGDSAFAFCAGLEKIWIPETTVKIGNNVFLIENEEPVYDLPEIDFGFGGSEDEVPEWNDLSSTHPENLTIHGVEGSYAQTYAEAHDIPFIANVYNLGEETYSFKNYIDDDSVGHCFGMSVTSAGYYLGILDKSAIGIELPQELYTVPGTQTTKAPICHYQHIQGNYTHFALVAGSTTYYNSGKTSEQCWNEVVDYVKSHRFDNMGNLQIQIWKTVTNDKTRENEESGHAVNFLYYKNVEGQDRLYAYDKNFPNTEVYFYLRENGKIYEAPRSTYGNTYTDTICLVDMDKYFEAAQNYRSNRYVYAKAGDVEIDAATAYPMACAGESMVMYEIPANLTQIVIKPMVDDAKIEYMDHTYCFGKLEEEKIGVLTLAESDDEASFGSVTFTVVDAQESHEPNCVCGQYHSGPFAVLTKFFHQIIYFFKNLFR